MMFFKFLKTISPHRTSQACCTKHYLFVTTKIYCHLTQRPRAFEQSINNQQPTSPPYMKSIKTLSLGILGAVGLASSASAQTYIHIVGSTAFRNADTAAMIDYLSTHLASGSTSVYAGYTGTASTTGILSAGAAIIANGTIGTTGSGSATVVFETSWTGSLAGVVDLVAQNSNNTVNFIDPTTMGSTSISSVNTSGQVTASTYRGGAGALTPTAFYQVAPDVAFSDSYQGTISKELGSGATLSAKVGNYSTIGSLATACAGGTIAEAGTGSGVNQTGYGFIGIVPFEWVVGNIASGGNSIFSNITQQASIALIGTGSLAQGNLTGTDNTADYSNYLYLIGRNEDSGTRIGALSESQFGVTGSPFQFEPTVTGASASGVTPVVYGSVTGNQLYPISPLNTEPNIEWNKAGHSGYASGGNVASALAATENTAYYAFTPPSGSTATGQAADQVSLNGSAFGIGYLGVTDAATAIKGGGKALSYNGVPFSIAAVESGQYTFWTYEHCYRLAGTTGVSSMVDSLADLVFNTDADVASDGTHSEGTGTTLSGGVLDNPNAPVFVYRSLIEGGPISNY
jgi:hypothetical protein